MKLKTLLAVAVAGAFASPLAAHASADGDRMILAQSGGPTGAAAAGATGRYHRLDTNRDGRLSADEIRGWRDPMGANPGEAAAGGGTTGTTAGPGEASPRTAPSSDSATSPSTSGGATIPGSPAAAPSGQKFAEDLFAACMKSGGNMDTILGYRS